MSAKPAARPSQHQLYRLCAKCEGVGTVPGDAVHIASHPDNSLKVARTPKRFPRQICPTCLGRRFVSAGFTVEGLSNLIRERDQYRGRYGPL